MQSLRTEPAVPGGGFPSPFPFSKGRVTVTSSGMTGTAGELHGGAVPATPPPHRRPQHRSARPCRKARGPGVTQQHLSSAPNALAAQWGSPPLKAGGMSFFSSGQIYPDCFSRSPKTLAPKQALAFLFLALPFCLMAVKWLLESPNKPGSGLTARCVSQAAEQGAGSLQGPAPLDPEPGQAPGSPPVSPSLNTASVLAPEY